MTPSDSQPSPDVSWARLIGRWSARTLLIGWLLSLLAVLALMRLVGEQNLTTAFFLYLPPAVWFLPAILLIPLSFVLSWRWGTLMLAASGILWLHIFGLPIKRGPSFPQRPAGAFVVLTNNRGQSANHSLQPFKNATQPDVVVLQEASARAPYYLRAPEYAEFTAAQSVGEFTLLSRHPITTASPITLDQNGKKTTVAVRFEVQWNSTAIAIYAVHLPSPRHALGFQARGPFVLGMIGWMSPGLAQRRDTYQAYWNQQIELACFLRDHLKDEKLPAIVAGDFNAPQLGFIQSMFSDLLSDAHATAGTGAGFTFPGTTHMPLSLGGPWMRIDYIFASKDWRVTHCLTEPDRPSQHRALAAVLEPKANP